MDRASRAGRLPQPACGRPCLGDGRAERPGVGPARPPREGLRRAGHNLPGSPPARLRHPLPRWAHRRRGPVGVERL